MHRHRWGARWLVGVSTWLAAAGVIAERGEGAGPEPSLTATQIYESAEITGGDLVLFVPHEPESLRGKGPLAAFTPVSPTDRMQVALSVPHDDYYNVMITQISSPRFSNYVLWVDRFRIPDTIGIRWATVQLRGRQWAQVRLKRGRHVLRFSKAVGANGEAVMHPLAIATIALQPGRLRSFFIEAERLSVVGADAEAFRPMLGGRVLSGYGELLLPAKGPGDAHTVELPRAPAKATHLVAALSVGPDRGIAELELDGAKPGTRVDTYGPAAYSPTVLAVFGLDPSRSAPRRLRVACVGRNPKSSGHALGVDGVAFGVDRTIEAEWLTWLGPWGANRVPYSTGSGRVSDRGYIGGHCPDTAKALAVGLDLPWAGTFQLAVRLCRAPNQGKLQVQFDDRLFPKVVDTHHKRHQWPREWITFGTVTLKPGTHTLRVWCREPDASRRGVRIDAIRFTPQH